MFKNFMNNFMSNGSTISTVNGVTYVNGKKINAPAGASISVSNNKVYVNGTLVEDCESCKEIIIKIEGNTGSINAGNKVQVTGNVNGDIDAGNTVEVGGDVKGSIDAGNTVNVEGSVSGNIDAGNSVYHR